MSRSVSRPRRLSSRLRRVIVSRRRMHKIPAIESDRPSGGCEDSRSAPAAEPLESGPVAAADERGRQALGPGVSALADRGTEFDVGAKTPRTASSVHPERTTPPTDDAGCADEAASWMGLCPAPRPVWPRLAGVDVEARHGEWTALVASLRQDMEQRRAWPATTAPPGAAVDPAVRARPSGLGPRGDGHTKPVQDEWGFFDPDQCGFAAILAKLKEMAARRASADDPDEPAPA